MPTIAKPKLKKPKQKEASVHYQVAQYMKLQYPDVIFRTDFAAGIRMTMGQAVKHKSLQSSRAYPDLFVAKVVPSDGIGGKLSITRPDAGYAGLYIELKRPNTKLKKQNGEWASEHIAEQAEVLEKLRAEGYKAEFAVGFEEAKQIIDEYLKR